MSDSLTKLLDRVSDDSARGLLGFIESLGLSMDDARIEDFLAQTNLIDEIHQQNTAHIEKTLRTILTEQQKVNTVEIIDAAIQKSATVAIDHTKISEDVRKGMEDYYNEPGSARFAEPDIDDNTKSTALPSTTIMGGIAAIALLIGIIGCAAFANFVWVPKAVDANYLKNTGDLKYLNSSEGKMFRKIVQLNSGYLDLGKCKVDAVASKLTLTHVGSKDKISSVCVLVVP